jgi:hypothetical protein
VKIELSRSKKTTDPSGTSPISEESSVGDVEDPTPEDTGQDTDDDSPNNTENAPHQMTQEEAQKRAQAGMQALLILPEFIADQKLFNSQVKQNLDVVNASLGEISKVKDQLSAIVDAYQKKSMDGVAGQQSLQQGASQMGMPSGGVGTMMQAPSRPLNPSPMGSTNLDAYADPMRSQQPMMGAMGSMTGNPMGDSIINAIVQSIMMPQNTNPMGEVMSKLMMQSFIEDLSLSRDIRFAVRRKLVIDVTKGITDGTPDPLDQMTQQLGLQPAKPPQAKVTNATTTQS